MRSSIRLLACSAALFFAASSWADQVVEKPVVADAPDKFAQTISHIHQEMSAGGRYEFIRPDEKAKVEVDLNTMASMLQKSGSVQAMSQSEKVNLFNTQEHVNGILTHSDSNRLICEHRAPTGTSIPRTMCQTLGEVETMRRATHKLMDDGAILGLRCMGQKINRREVCKSN
jgi:hypothetical protein